MWDLIVSVPDIAFLFTLYVFIRNHVESFKCDMLYEPCHGETCLCQYVAWVSRV